MPAPVIAIRRARVDDEPAICAIEAKVSAIPGLLVSGPDELSAESVQRMIARLDDGAGCFVVAEDNAAIVGHAFLRPMDLRATSHVYRLTIVVRPSYWRRGVGRALMGALREWAVNSPLVAKVELLVRATNAPARTLYAEFGFVDEGRLRNRIRLPSGSYVDDISMAWFPKSEHA